MVVRASFSLRWTDQTGSHNPRLMALASAAATAALMIPAA